MERLLVVRLDVTDCEAEVILNGIPLARASAARPKAVVPVHEFTVSGPNRLELVVWPRTFGPAEPPPAPALVCDGTQSARARILLPRIGNAIDEAASRTLGQIDWAPAAGTRLQPPLTLAEDVSLPVNFPRWRWLDAPAVADAGGTVRDQVAAWLRVIADDLAAGQTERFVAAARLRTEEIAVAYQRRPEDEFNRLRAHLMSLHAVGGLKWPPTLAQDLLLRPVAGGRLLECVDKAGGPALRTEPDERGQTWAMPMRVAAVAGKIHLLR
jgi:hypothetical protein